MNLKWTDQVIEHWVAKGITLTNGISGDEILQFEKQLDFKFPNDFIELYTMINGFEDGEWNEYMFSLWSIDRILQEYREENDKDYIGFCDYLINTHSIGFVKSHAGIYKSYDHTKPVANTFKDVIILINSNSDLVY